MVFDRTCVLWVLAIFKLCNLIYLMAQYICSIEPNFEIIYGSRRPQLRISCNSLPTHHLNVILHSSLFFSSLLRIDRVKRVSSKDLPFPVPLTLSLSYDDIRHGEKQTKMSERRSGRLV